ncbi:hypothetical protein [Candidatus Symbiopectobacterium sp.]|nr:hypothetical protein [Candidatus Symbiopectobacterium sp.]
MVICSDDYPKVLFIQQSHNMIEKLSGYTELQHKRRNSFTRCELTL